MPRLDDLKEKRNSIETSGDLSKKDKKCLTIYGPGRIY